MNPLIFATNNAHKIEEVNSILNNEFNIRSLKDEHIDFDIPEPFDTIEENAEADFHSRCISADERVLQCEPVQVERRFAVDRGYDEGRLAI